MTSSPRRRSVDCTIGTRGPLSRVFSARICVSVCGAAVNSPFHSWDPESHIVMNETSLQATSGVQAENETETHRQLAPMRFSVGTGVNA